MFPIAPQDLLLAQESTGGSPASLLVTFLVLGVFMYLFFIAPQRRRMKAAETMRTSIAVGDDVRTIGGIFGTVRQLDADEVHLDVGGGTTLRVAKRAIAERLTSGDA
ncbi:MAG TPA: preprotein translocase subunit YajC [Acidimicrobiia bacterium]